MRPTAASAATWVLVATGCGRSVTSGELLVFAAVSTAEVMNEAGRDFHDRTGETVRFSFGASHDLARQVRAGAPADVLVSADRETVDTLVADDLATRDRRILASNGLVVIVPLDSPLDLSRPDDLESARRIALGDPQIAPVGAYAKNWLERAGVWEGVRQHVVPTLDARAALAAVESGRAEAGIVYATDAATSPRIRIAYRVPRESAPDIVYVAAPIIRSKKAAAGAFLDYLTGDDGRRAFARHGFIVEGRPP